MNHEKIQPIRRLKVADSIAEQLESMISDGGFPAGDKLPPERVLAEQFGVGRSSMREAIRIVEAHGMLRTDHGIGVFVVSKTRRTPDLSNLLILDEYTVPDLFEARITLERDAAGFAAQRIEPDGANVLHGIIAEMADSGLSDEDFVALDANLHRTITRITKNPILLTLHSSIEPLFMDYSLQVIGLPGRRETADIGHRAIVDAVVGKRVREARTAAVKHIRDVERDIIANFTDVHSSRQSTASDGRSASRYL